MRDRNGREREGKEGRRKKKRRGWQRAGGEGNGGSLADNPGGASCVGAQEKELRVVGDGWRGGCSSLML